MATQDYGTTWWGQEWLNALTGIDNENRIPRGKTYANTGKVYRIEFDTNRGLIKARVKGNYDPFYSVQIRLKRFTQEEIDELVAAIADSPVVLAHLSARELDPQIEKIADSLEISIFPKKWNDLDVKCSCPDYAVPCKHIAAVIYKISQEIDTNPFILFELKGLDLVAELADKGIDFEQVEQTEMPVWKDLLNVRAVGGPLPLSSLEKLSFSQVNPLLESVVGLFSESPAGYTGPSLRNVLTKVLGRAQKSAANKFKDKVDRDLPSWDENEPLIHIDSWGRVHFARSMSWGVYPATGESYVATPFDPSEGDYEAHKPLFDMFSGATNKDALADSHEAIEALYNIWVIATKLVEQGAVVPQIYEPIDENFIIRWIPAFMEKDISTLTDEAGRALLSLPESVLQIDRRPEILSGRVVGEAVLGAFIDSYVIASFVQSPSFSGFDNDEYAPEIQALFLRNVIDTVDFIAGDRVRRGLESWLSPLYLENLEVRPVVILEDRSIHSSFKLADLIESKRQKDEDEEDIDESFYEDIFYDTDYDNSSVDDDDEDDEDPEVETEVIIEGKPDHDASMFDNEDGICISMGFNRIDQQGLPDEVFIPLKDILGDPRYGKIRFECLRTVSRLSSICPQLSDLLENRGGEGTIKLEDLANVILSSIPAMKLLGVRLIIPKTLTKILSPKASVSLGISGKFDLEDGMGVLASMLSFDWQLALGNNSISPEEFERLMEYEGRMVRFGDQFVYVDPKTVARIGKKLKETKKETPTKQRLIAAALTGRFGNNSVYITKELKAALDKLLSEKALSIPDTLNATLRPYQERGFSWLVRNMRTMMGSIIADDMGLGKTLQVIASLEKLRFDGELDKKQALIVVPTSVLVNWQKEICKFAPKMTYSVFYADNKNLDTTTNIVLTTYGTLRTQLKIFKTMALRVVVIDEAQTIKNSKSQLFKAVRSLQSDSMIAMSGTPVENRLLEYWSIMDFVNPGLLGSVSDFKSEFADPIERNRDKQAASRLRRVTAPFIMRRLKSDKRVISDLPEKITQDTYCTLTPVQVALYQNQLNESMALMAAAKQSAFARSAVILNMIEKLKKICNAPEHFNQEEPHKGPDYSGKAETMFSILEDLRSAHRKVLIFTQFKEMGDILQRWIEERMGFKPKFIHGGVKASERAEIVEQFQTRRSEKVLILTLKAAGTGLNLTEASAVIHYDLWWNPAVEAQATDRAYRIGQKQNVQVYRLICANSFEERINQMIESKKELADMTVNVGEKWIGEMSNRQLEEIFTISDKDAVEDAPAKKSKRTRKSASAE